METTPATQNPFFDNTAALIPACKAMGEVIAASGWFNCTRSEQGIAIAYISQAERLSLLQLLAEYHFVNGKPMLKAEAMAARFRRKGGRIVIVERSPKRALLKASLDGPASQFEETWEEIEKEPWTKGKDGKLKDTYATARAREKMLWHRCVTDAIRTLAPEVTSGLPVEIEFADPEPEPPPALDLGKPATQAPPPPPPPPKPPEPEPPLVVEAEGAPLVPVDNYQRVAARRDPITGRLDEDTVAAIRQLIGENEEGARALSVLRKHMTKDDARRENWVEYIPLVRAVGILNNPDLYRDAIKPGNALP
jgi:hypothetical protein